MKEIIRRSIDRRRASAGSESAASVAAALATGDLAAGLSKWIGTDGCHALFTRAKAEAEATHPALGALTLRPRAAPYVEGVDGALETYGDAATLDGIESMLLGIVELLGRLIGPDMAKNLIDQGLPDAMHDQAGAQKRSAEA